MLSYKGKRKGTGSSSQMSKMLRRSEPIEDATRRVDESGQVYVETVHRGRSAGMHWSRKSLGMAQRSADASRQTSEVTALQDLCIQCVLANTDLLPNDAFNDIPTGLGRRIWAAARKQGRESMHVWKLFMAAYGASFGNVKEFATYEKTIRISDGAVVPSNEDIAAILPLTVLNATMQPTWITHLSIFSDMRTLDYRNVARIPNLASLELASPHSFRGSGVLDRRIVKYWLALAQEGLAFSCLRVLILRGDNILDDAGVADRLAEFPMLKIIMVWIDSDQNQSRVRRLLPRSSWTEIGEDGRSEAAPFLVEHLMKGGHRIGRMQSAFRCQDPSWPEHVRASDCNRQDLGQLYVRFTEDIHVARRHLFAYSRSYSCEAQEEVRAQTKEREAAEEGLPKKNRLVKRGNAMASMLEEF